MGASGCSPTARRTRVRLDNLTAVVRVEQERPREAREWALRAMADDQKTTVAKASMSIRETGIAGEAGDTGGAGFQPARAA